MWEMDYDAAARYWNDKSTAAPLMITGELRERVDRGYVQKNAQI